MDVKFEHCYIYEGNLVAHLRNFMDNDLKGRCYTHVLDLDVEFAYSEEPVPFSEIGSLTFQPIKVGEVWARKNFACEWFHLTGKLPKDVDRKELYFAFGIQGEALLLSHV